MTIEAAVIGVSAGGFQAMSTLVTTMTDPLTFGIMVVQHLRENSDDFFARHLDSIASFQVKEAEEKGKGPSWGDVCGSSGYHLLVEDDKTLSLSVDPRVSYARPSVDVLFESAAEVYGPRLAGIVLTGANSDGAKGLLAVKAAGGLAIVQDPQTAQYPTMPREALEVVNADYVMSLEKIGAFLVSGTHGDPDHDTGNTKGGQNDQ